LKKDIGAQPPEGPPPFPYADLLREIQVEWNKAEEAVKRSEQLTLEVSIPAISELRYGGRRLVDALDQAHRGGDDAKIRALLEDARFCCYRAQHDAIDSALATIGIDLDDLSRRLGFEAVIDAYPEFREFYAEFNLARGKIVESRRDRPGRNDIYEALTATDLPKLTAHYQRLIAVQPIAKRSALRRRLGSVYGFLILVAALAAAVFTGLAVDWNKYLGSPAPEQIQAPAAPALPAPQTNNGAG
jgi:hypothetical protein